MLLTGRQLKAGRALAGLSQRQLADAATLNVNTILAQEACDSATLTSGLRTIRKIEAALLKAGVVCFEQDAKPGVRLR